MARPIASNSSTAIRRTLAAACRPSRPSACLADVATGYPRLLADMTLATAFRTAAVSALAARYLARPESETMALIGLGAQSEFQACAFQAALGVNRLRIYDVDPAAAEKFQRNMANSGLSIIRCASAQDAVIGADIVTTITADKQRATILSDNMVGAGTHLNAVGGDCPGKTELARDILLRAEIFVEYAPQTRLEGEIQQLSADHPVTELVGGRRRPKARAPFANSHHDFRRGGFRDRGLLRPPSASRSCRRVGDRRRDRSYRAAG